jgi:hypothetical protein
MIKTLVIWVLKIGAYLEFGIWLLEFHSGTAR